MANDWKWNEESQKWEQVPQPVQQEVPQEEKEESWEEDPKADQKEKNEYIPYNIEESGQQDNQQGEFMRMETPQRPQKSGIAGKILLTTGLAVLFGVVAGSIIVGLDLVGKGFLKEESPKIPQVQVQVPENDILENGNIISEKDSDTTEKEVSVADVAENCMPSVVSITNASVARVQDFFGGIMETPVETSGSGIIVGQNDKELLIATNNHVVEGGETLTVGFCDGELYEAVTKGNDAANDLAVIAVNLETMGQETLDSIRVVNIGDSSTLRIGEQVVAIGNALGYGQSVTSGWISALNRSMEDENGNMSGNLIQTDAAINHGNSGGPLLNMKGELIGINSSKLEGVQVEAMGYAIPVSVARPILDELMNRTTRFKVPEEKRAYIGVVCLNVESSAASKYGIPQGAFIDSVEEDGPAAQAGILKGDVIVQFDGVKVSGSTDLVSKLEYYEAGEEVQVVISRAENGVYVEKELSVALGKRSDMKQKAPRR